tara:strand:- start:767 stop:988 length:222 start_codon:yes stop_codon:yes gene_type:complete
MEEIKTKIIEEIVCKYIDADIMPEDDGDIMSDAEYCKQIVECLIDTKVKHGNGFNLPQTVKYLKIDIVESYAP